MIKTNTCPGDRPGRYQFSSGETQWSILRNEEYSRNMENRGDMSVSDMYREKGRRNNVNLRIHKIA